MSSSIYFSKSASMQPRTEAVFPGSLGNFFRAVHAKNKKGTATKEPSEVYYKGRASKLECVHSLFTVEVPASAEGRLEAAKRGEASPGSRGTSELHYVFSNSELKRILL